MLKWLQTPLTSPEFDLKMYVVVGCACVLVAILSVVAVSVSQALMFALLSGGNFRGAWLAYRRMKSNSSLTEGPTDLPDPGLEYR